MASITKADCMGLIKFLHDGKMDNSPLIKPYVNKFKREGDCSSLREYLEQNPQFVHMAKRNIYLKQQQELENGGFLVPSRNDVQKCLSGPFRIGYVNKYGDYFGIGPDSLNLLFFILGRPGTSKSNTIKVLLHEILSKPQDFNVIIPDLKMEYRNLLSLTSNLRVITLDKFRINPLQCPVWMDPKAYIFLFCKIFCKENWLLVTSEGVLIDILTNMYKINGIFENSKNYPTLQDLYNVVSYLLEKEKTFRFKDILQLIKTRLIHYTASDNFTCQTGIPDEVWRKENIVLELDEGISDYVYNFIVAYLMGLRYEYNKKFRLAGSILHTLVIADEARRLLKPRNELEYGETYITEIITKIREYGVSLVAASHETSSLNTTIKALSYTKLCFPLSDGVDTVRDMFGLNEDQAKILFKLPRFGKGIVRFGGYEPFLLTVPEIKLDCVSDEQIKTHMAPFWAEIDKHIRYPSPPPQAKPDKPTDAIPQQPLALLKYLGKEPFTKVSDMTNAPGLTSQADVEKALRWLEENGFLTREAYKVSKKGRKAVFGVLTQKAYLALKVSPGHGKGHFEHRLHQRLVSQRHEKDGFEVKIEGRVNDSQKLIDVLAFSESQGPVAYEITLHFENLVSNIRQDLDAGVTKVVIVTRDKTAMQKAQKIIENDRTINPDLVEHRLITDFLD